MARAPVPIRRYHWTSTCILKINLQFVASRALREIALLRRQLLSDLLDFLLVPLAERMGGRRAHRESLMTGNNRDKRVHKQESSGRQAHLVDRVPRGLEVDAELRDVRLVLALADARDTQLLEHLLQARLRVHELLARLVALCTRSIARLCSELLVTSIGISELTCAPA